MDRSKREDEQKQSGSDVRKRRRTGALRERWLEEKVGKLYQDVVNEPVPNDLLKILDRLPTRDK